MRTEQRFPKLPQATVTAGKYLPLKDSSNSRREEIVQKRRLEAAVTALASRKFMAPELSLAEWFRRRRDLLQQSREILARRKTKP